MNIDKKTQYLQGDVAPHVPTMEAMANQIDAIAERLLSLYSRQDRVRELLFGSVPGGAPSEDTGLPSGRIEAVS